jgi:hypothetical protein
MNFPGQLSAQRKAELDALSVDQLRASYRDAAKARKSSLYKRVTWNKVSVSLCHTVMTTPHQLSSLADGGAREGPWGPASSEKAG